MAGAGSTVGPTSTTQLQCAPHACLERSSSSRGSRCANRVLACRGPPLSGTPRLGHMRCAESTHAHCGPCCTSEVNRKEQFRGICGLSGCGDSRHPPASTLTARVVEGGERHQERQQHEGRTTDEPRPAGEIFGGRCGQHGCRACGGAGGKRVGRRQGRWRRRLAVAVLAWICAALLPLDDHTEAWSPGVERSQRLLALSASSGWCSGKPLHTLGLSSQGAGERNLLSWPLERIHGPPAPDRRFWVLGCLPDTCLPCGLSIYTKHLMVRHSIQLLIHRRQQHRNST